jgi:hypothetical protein
MKVGETVIYQGEKYKIVFVYESGYVEIRKVSGNDFSNTTLVEKSEIQSFNNFGSEQEIKNDR